jgi:hypothetical protein
MLSLKTVSSFSVELLLLKDLSVILFVMEMLQKTVSQNVDKAVTPKTCNGAGYLIIITTTENVLCLG